MDCFHADIIIVPVQGTDQVGDNERLWRRIHSAHVKDEADGSRRVTSGAFKDAELSVDRAELVDPAVGWRFTLGEDPIKGVGVAELMTRGVRSEGLEVVPRPVTENEAHAEIHGRKSQPIARRLAQQSVAYWPDDTPGRST